MIGDRKESQKIIRVKNLNEDTDIPELAKKSYPADFLPDLVKIVTEEKFCLLDTPRDLYSSKKSTLPNQTLKMNTRKQLSGETLNAKDNRNSSSHIFESRLKLVNNKTDENIDDDDDGDNTSYLDEDDDDENRCKSKDEDFILECLGCLANLDLKDIQYSKVITEFNLLKWIKSRLDSVKVRKSRDFLSATSEIADNITQVFSQSMFPSHIEDDIILEIVRMLGAICQDPDAGRLVIESGIVHSLISLLNAKQEDDEIVFQIIFTFFQLIFHESTRNLMVKTTQAIAYLVDLMHDKNADIRKLCDITLDIISEYESDWRVRIQTERFRWHNSQWLEMIGTANNPGLLDNADNTTEAALAAILGDDLTNIIDEDDNNNQGYFGMGLGIDDAATFLMSLQSNTEGSKRSAGSEHLLGVPYEDSDYINHLNMLYPDMYGDVDFLSNERVSSAMTPASQYDSDSDTTRKRSDSQNSSNYENDKQDDKIFKSVPKYFELRSQTVVN
ncbi:unnamed protein product [Heterobilharzia americana]|nr:unnamed protein product [Heterobilharzia americana]